MQSIVGDGPPEARGAGSDWGQSLWIDNAPDAAGDSRFEVRPIDPAAADPPAADPAPADPGETTTRISPARAAGRPEPASLRRRPNESLLEAKLRLIQVVSEKLVRIFDPKQLLDEILAIMMEQTGADRGLLCLLDEQRRPVPISARGLEEGAQVRVSRTVLRTLLDRRSGVLIQQASAAANILRSLEEMNVCSTLCVPLWTGESIIGLLSLDSTRATKLFTDDDLDLLLAVAHQAAIGIERGRLSQLVETERQAKAYLSKYLDNRIVEQIARRGDGEDPLAPAEKIVTVLFSDIVSFTKICEGLPPVQVAEFIREYLTAMTETVFAHGGTIDKYIGDAIMALFGAPMPSPNSATSAIRAALDMRVARPRFSPAARRRGLAGAGGDQHGAGRRGKHRLRAADGIHGDRRRGERRRPAAGLRPAERNLHRRNDLRADLGRVSGRGDRHDRRPQPGRAGEGVRSAGNEITAGADNPFMPLLEDAAVGAAAKSALFGVVQAVARLRVVNLRSDRACRASGRGGPVRRPRGPAAPARGRSP